MRKKLLGLVLLACAAHAATTLTGVFYAPQGGLATGTLVLTPPTGATLLVSCGGISGGVTPGPSGPINVTVTAGVISGTLTVTGNDCLAPANTVYLVQYTDGPTGAVWNAQWYIFGSTFSVTNQAVALPGVAVLNPNGNQTINQPAGTSLVENYLKVTRAFLPPQYTMAEATYAAVAPGDIVVFTDATVLGSCVSAGGGTNRSLCRWTGSAWESLGGGAGGGGSATWGAIIGTLSNQADLQAALNAKVATTVTVNGHALSSNVVVSASDLTTGTLPHAQLPALVSGDIPNNAANTTGTAAALGATPTLCSTGQAPTGVLANGNATGCAAIGGAGLTGITNNGDGSLNTTVAVTWAAANAPTYNAGGTTTCNFALSNVCAVSPVTSGTTLNFTGGHGTGLYLLRTIQGGTPVSLPYTFGSGILGGQQPDGNANRYTEQVFSYDGTSYRGAQAYCPLCTYSQVTTNTAPTGNPPSGYLYTWLDPTTLLSSQRDSAGNIKGMVKGIPNPSDSNCVLYVDVNGVQQRGACGGGSGFGGVISKTTNYTAQVGDANHLVVFNGSSLTYTLPSPLSSTWAVGVLNLNSTPLSVSAGAFTLNGVLVAITLNQYQLAWIFTDGSVYYGNYQESASNFTSTGATIDITQNGQQVNLEVDSASQCASVICLNITAQSTPAGKTISFPPSASLPSIRIPPSAIPTTRNSGLVGALNIDGAGGFDWLANSSFYQIFLPNTITADRTVLLPDANSNTVQGIANPSDTNVINYIDAAGVQHRIAQTGAGGITALTGDVTATGPGSVAATIATGAVVNAKLATNLGKFGNNLHAQCDALSYGAAGDNTTEDLLALENMIADGCSDVYLPNTTSNKYKIVNQPFIVGPGTTIHGAGGIGSGSDSGPGLECYSTGNCVSVSASTQGKGLSGGTVTGTAGQTCTATFSAGTATVTLTQNNTNALSNLSAFMSTTFSTGVTKTTATLTSGSATCSGTGTFLITLGARDVRFKDIEIGDNYGSRTNANGDGLTIDGTGDAAIFDIDHVYVNGFANAVTVHETIDSSITGGRFLNAKNFGLFISTTSTSLNVRSTIFDGDIGGCVWISALSYSGFYNTGCDNAGGAGGSTATDGYVMDSSARPTAVGFYNTGCEAGTAPTRHCYVIEGQSHVLMGVSGYVKDTATYSTIYLDNVAQIKIDAPQTKNGSYGIVYTGGGLATTFAGYPIVTLTGWGNCTAGSNMSGITAGQPCAQYELNDPTNVVVRPGVVGLLAGTSHTVLNLSETYVCTAACTVTPLPPMTITGQAAQLCVQNDMNVSGGITLAALTGISYEVQAQTSYKSAATSLVSTGAVGDQICIVGRDSTHYNIWSIHGTFN